MPTPKLLAAFDRLKEKGVRAPRRELEIGADWRVEVAYAPVEQQLAVAHHRAQALGQGLEGPVVGEGELVCDGRGGQRFAGPRQRVQDQFAAGDRALVAGRFAFAVGVFG